MKIAYLDCFSGISGDMFLGALLDAGVPLSVMEDSISRLRVGAQLRAGRVDRSGISATKVDVLTEDGLPAEGHSAGKDHHVHAHEHTHSEVTHSHGADDPGHSHAAQKSHSGHSHGRSLSVIRTMILDSSLPPAVQRLALNAFESLGAAEAKIHDVPVETIHFHEVGALDAIVDIVATAAGCHWLKIDQWICSPLNVGGGHVHCAHGTFPVPAPATLELLRDLPVYSSGVQKELVTPTGAALLRALQVKSSAFPAMSMQATGYGAGSNNSPGRPNVLRLVVGESAARINPGHSHQAPTREQIGIIETTIDDATPELLSYVADRLLAAGASDVVRTPVVMKKGRSGIQLTVVCSPERASQLQRLIFQETTTLGLRYREEEKHILHRSFVDVETEWGKVPVKIGTTQDGEMTTYSPEYEDCRKLAEKNGVALKQVMQAAVAAFLAGQTAKEKTNPVEAVR
ncbi:MAG TPA: nickel pincer cofactor biosynthesis protein LarC [Acidobacteriaceae bacterium]|nr:nickel pincer cofactor biosynthesis protein LarC [Acidobacteriaceae bacterium]